MMADVGGIVSERLRTFVERIESLEEEKSQVLTKSEIKKIEKSRNSLEISEIRGILDFQYQKLDFQDFTLLFDLGDTSEN